MGKLSLTRRGFMKLSAVTGVAAAALGGATYALAESGPKSSLVEGGGDVVRVRTGCRGCGKMECGVIAVVENGRVVRLEGDPTAFQSMGNCCTKSQAAVQAAYHPDRLHYPMKRTNDKESDDPGWVRITWDEAMERYGSDKPDTRFGMELCDVSKVVEGCGFSVFTGALENGGSVRGINAKGQAGMPRKKIDKLVEFAKGYGAKGLAYLAVNEDGTYKSSFAKFMTEDELKALVSAMQGEPGDLLLFAAE